MCAYQNIMFYNLNTYNFHFKHKTTLKPKKKKIQERTFNKCYRRTIYGLCLSLGEMASSDLSPRLGCSH